jgi:RNA polymerase sigma factor (sigma-70 family)
MKEPKDQELISKILLNNCSDSLSDLVERHSGMFFSIGKKYAIRCGINMADLSDNRHLVTFNAAKSYNADKGAKFSTWLGNQVRYFCLNYNTKNSRLIPTEDSILEFIINNENQHSPIESGEVMATIVDLFDEISDANTKNAIYYRYFYNKDRILNYSEIAEILKVTPQTVLNWHNKFISFAKQRLVSQGIKENV